MRGGREVLEMIMVMDGKTLERCCKEGRRDGGER